MKQETIGSKGTVPGFRPLIGDERWHKDTFTAEALVGRYRPLLLGEPWIEGDEIDRSYRLEWQIGVNDGRDILGTSTSESTAKCRTKRPLPPPAVETFEAHGHIWYKHMPGDECPVEPDVSVDVLWSKQMSHPHHFTGIYVAKYQNWSKTADGESVIGYRFPDYPAVQTTLQQEQPFAERLADLHVIAEKEALQLELQDMKQQLTSIYNGWVHLSPETVAECIADVASVLYPTDAERCEAAFQRWWNEISQPGMNQGLASEAWTAAWFDAKKSK